MKTVIAILLTVILFASCKKNKIEQSTLSIEIFNEAELPYEGSIMTPDGEAVKTYKGSKKYFTEEVTMPTQDYLRIYFVINTRDLPLDSAGNNFWIKTHDSFGSVVRHLMHVPSIDSIHVIIIDSKLPQRSL